ncbi:hypothetical protein HY489_06430 [Candidatus Woesearchaeota archaeon]|nr:hypothetical protein [Candidatus Woesearchaeota archaeon]
MHVDKQLTQHLISQPGFDPCTICGMPMLANKCKILCMHCGFKRDCSDS